MNIVLFYTTFLYFKYETPHIIVLYKYKYDDSGVF